jgi:hypothetical protein
MTDHYTGQSHVGAHILVECTFTNMPVVSFGAFRARTFFRREHTHRMRRQSASSMSKHIEQASGCYS